MKPGLKPRLFLYSAQILVTVLFLINFQKPAPTSAAEMGGFFALALLGIIIVNSFWCSRFTSWLIFAGAFFGFLVTLSAFTLRWRLEPGFNSTPFYLAIVMYMMMVYIGLAQMKLHFKGI